MLLYKNAKKVIVATYSIGCCDRRRPKNQFENFHKNKIIKNVMESSPMIYLREIIGKNFLKKLKLICKNRVSFANLIVYRKW